MPRSVLSCLLVCATALSLASTALGFVKGPAQNGRVKVTEQGEWVLTPFGWWPAECVHGVPAGAHVTNNDDHLHVAHGERTAVVPRCATPAAKRSDNPRKQQPQMDEGDGWQQYVHQNVGNVTALLGQWTVPVAPSEDAQTLFTFTGLQNIDWVPPQPEPTGPFDIIQPVLQYGYSSAGGGDYWTVASWYVTLGTDVVYSELVQVNPGDVIFGNMTLLSTGTWYINGVDLQSGVQSPLTISRTLLDSQPWTYVTLEVYDVDDCGQYPPTGTPIPYTKLKLFVSGKEQTPKWTVGDQGQQPPVCSSSITIIDPSSVTISF